MKDPIRYGIGRFIGSDRFFDTRYRKIRDRIAKGDPIPWYRIEMVSDRDWDRIAIPIRHPNAAGCIGIGSLHPIPVVQYIGIGLGGAIQYRYPVSGPFLIRSPINTDPGIGSVTSL
ncbi:hypothetical protein PGTUg99_016263 [Puccinia graminis f. sp. tritici]|uniref:Uncharacterized protein n=1 Tax=Puccinia graminis f. sp. tritici TaxID=56615 RepID=A0A5B0NPD4_PUCGR|nr:hypothetical protein PGTUg99_016263 [Puccinia graminis f. sp. tritici]